jgi:hypothetical protein
MCPKCGGYMRQRNEPLSDEEEPFLTKLLREELNPQETKINSQKRTKII